MWGLDPCFHPHTKDRSSPINAPVFPPSSFILPSFAWFYIFFSTGQVLLSALSWCSACTSVSEGVFLMYLWREMYSTSTYSSAILFSRWILWLVCSCCPRDSGVFFSTTVWKHQFFAAQPSLWTNSHICTWLLEKPQLSLYGSLSAKRCLCFLIRCLGLSRFSKEQVPFNFMAAVTVHIDFGAQDNKLFHCFHFSPSICHEMIGPYAMILDFWMLSIKPAFSLSSSPSSRSSLFLFTFCH